MYRDEKERAYQRSPIRLPILILAIAIAITALIAFKAMYRM